MVMMFTIGSLNSLWLALGIARNWLVIQRPVHPLLYGLLAWAGWQFIALPFSNNPLRSWMGIPQTGEGAAWQIMLVLSVAMTMPVWQSSWHANLYKKIILSVAVFGLCIMTYLHFNPNVFCPLLPDDYNVDTSDAPANWPDYLPFIAAWTWIAYSSVPSLRTKFRHVFMITTFVLVLIIGQNSTAHPIMMPIIIGFNMILFLHLIKRKPLWIKRLITANKAWKCLAVLGTLVPLLWVVISQFPDFFPCKRASSAIRAIYNQTTIATIIDNPQSFIMGKGWISSSDDMLKYGLRDGLASFRNGIFSPSNQWLYGNVFHPHNQPMQALLATGIIGFIIFMALPILAIWSLRRTVFWWCVPVFLVLNIMGYLWFNLPQTLAFQALGLTALCAGRKTSILLSTNLPRWLSTICILLALLFASSSYEQTRIINYGDDQRLKMMMNYDPDTKGIIDWIAGDIPRGGERMVEAITYFSQDIANRVTLNSADENDRDWYRNFLELAHRAAISKNAGVVFGKLEVELSMLPFRLMQNSPLDDLKPQIKENLLDAILRLTAQAPQREDFIAPFLMSLDGFTHDDRAKQRDILEKILEITPNHRSALWLLGTLEGNDEMKKRAVKLGVEHVYPITKEELLPYRE